MLPTKGGRVVFQMRADLSIFGGRLVQSWGRVVLGPSGLRADMSCIPINLISLMWYNIENIFCSVVHVSSNFFVWHLHLYGCLIALTALDVTYIKYRKCTNVFTWSQFSLYIFCISYKPTIIQKHYPEVTSCLILINFCFQQFKQNSNIIQFKYSRNFQIVYKKHAFQITII